MKFGILITFLVLAALPVSAQTAKAKDKALAVKPGEWTQIHFSESVPLSNPEQLQLRLHLSEELRPYDLSQESFDVLVPKGYKKGTAYGLIVWVSAGNGVGVPKDWEKVMEDKKLIIVGARNAGNSRDSYDRMRLAVDANHNMRQLYTIDDRRVYVSGMSGGARVAAMLGVAYADMFTGAIPFMGANFYIPVRVGNEVFEARYLPVGEILDLAKKECRFALFTGTKDMNEKAITAMYEQGFKPQGFAAVELFDIPNQGHSLPNGDWFRKGIDYLDGVKSAPVKTKPARK